MVAKVKQRDPRGSRPGERRGGRQKGTLNKSTAEIKTLAQKYGPQIIANLWRMHNSSEIEDIRFRAGKELLDRGYGKSIAQTNLAGHDGGPIDFSTATDEQVDAAIARLAAIAGQDK